MLRCVDNPVHATTQPSGRRVTSCIVELYLILNFWYDLWVVCHFEVRADIAFFKIHESGAAMAPIHARGRCMDLFIGPLF